VKNSDHINFLLELLRGRTGKWDVVLAAIRSKDDFVRRVAVILVLAPPVILVLAPPVIATLACLLAVVR
jgi:hypothetical protein